jgi:hypothetical protein
MNVLKIIIVSILNVLYAIKVVKIVRLILIDVLLAKMVNFFKIFHVTIALKIVKHAPKKKIIVIHAKIR